MFFSHVFVAVAISASALATVFITNPVASTTMNGGQPFTITWQDDGNAPSLKDFGAAKISIYVGNAKQQTSLQLCGNVDVSTASSLQFTPDASIGPNGNEYFIRVESVNLKDATTPTYPALSFSGKFTMAGMTGKFSDAVQQQINGQSTAPIAAPTATGSSTPSTATASLTTSKVSSTATTTGTATGSASSAKSTSGASSLVTSGFAAAAGAVAVAALF